MDQTIEDLEEKYHDFIIDLNNFQFEKKLQKESENCSSEIDLYTNINNDKLYIVKKMPFQSQNDKSFQNFCREIEILSKVKSKFLLPFVGFTAKEPFSIITEYMKNGSLFDLLHSKSNDVLYSKLQLTQTQKTKIALSIVKGMIHLHENNIIHRDLKSQNILLDDNLIPKIADFGISRFKRNENDLLTNQLGTPQWMAPELFNSNNYTNKVDVYAFGMILYELVTSDIPFKEFNANQICIVVCKNQMRPTLPENTPQELSALIKRCWDQNPEKRPSFNEILSEMVENKIYFIGSQEDEVENFIKYNIYMEENAESDFEKEETIDDMDTTDETLDTKDVEDILEDVLTLDDNPEINNIQEKSKENNEISDNNTQNHDHSLEKESHIQKTNDENEKDKPTQDSATIEENNITVQEKPENVQEEPPKFEFNNMGKKVPLLRNKPNIFLGSHNDFHCKCDPPKYDNINEILSNPNHPLFIRAMQQSISSVDSSTCYKLFLIINEIVSISQSRDITSFLLGEIAHLLKRDNDCSKYFVESGLHTKLPYYDSSFSFSTLSILHSLVQKNPSALTKDIAQTIMNYSDSYGKQILAIFGYFTQSYDKVSNSLSVIDVLISNARTFIDNKLASGLVQILYYLQTNYKPFQEQRGVYCFYIYRSVCYCPDVRAVRQALSALTNTYDYQYGKVENSQLVLDTSLLAQLLQNALISPNVLNYMLKIDKQCIEINQEIIDNLLLHLNLEESYFVLCKIVDGNEQAASFLLTNMLWLDNSTTKIETLFNLFLLIYSFKNLREKLFSSEYFIDFINKILTSNDNEAIYYLSIIFEESCSSEHFVKELRKGKMLEHFFSLTSKSTDKKLQLYGLRFFRKVCEFSIGEETLVVLPHLKIWLEMDDDLKKESLKACIQLANNDDMKQALIKHNAIEKAKEIESCDEEINQLKQQLINFY